MPQYNTRLFVLIFLRSLKTNHRKRKIRHSNIKLKKSFSVQNLSIVILLCNYKLFIGSFFDTVDLNNCFALAHPYFEIKKLNNFRTIHPLEIS